MRRVNRDIQRHRGLETPNFVYDRVPSQRLDQYKQWRQMDQDRAHKFVFKRFPELEQAKDDYLGRVQDSKLPTKNMHAKEITQFSDVVYRLAQEQEPHRARVNYARQGTPPESKETEEKAPLESPFMRQKTLSNSVKDKYVVRSTHQQIGSLKFYPTSSMDAR